MFNKLRNIFCFHNWKKINKFPNMTFNESCSCRPLIKEKCLRCEKTREYLGDVYVGMEIIKNK